MAVVVVVAADVVVAASQDVAIDHVVGVAAGSNAVAATESIAVAYDELLLVDAVALPPVAGHNAGVAPLLVSAFAKPLAAADNELGLLAGVSVALPQPCA